MADLLLIVPIGTRIQWNLNQYTVISIQEYVFQDVVCKMFTIRPFCLGRNVIFLVIFESTSNLPWS